MTTWSLDLHFALHTSAVSTPPAYSPLDKPVQFLKLVGPRRAELLRKLGLLTARDVLYHVPRRYEDASTFVAIERVQAGM
jgi:ATP-dependent DNA helicase RecG